MKFIDRLINFIFSLVMIVISLVVLLAIFEFVEVSYINNIINDYVWNPVHEKIVIIVAVIIFLAGLKTTIFLADFKKKKKIPIMVSTNNGNIQIASETIESISKAVAKTYEDVKEVNAKMVNKTKGVEIYMSILVSQDTNISTLTRKIQEEVKSKVHDTTGVLVLNVDIKVKNIAEKVKKMASVETSSVTKSNLENTSVSEIVANNVASESVKTNSIEESNGKTEE